MSFAWIAIRDGVTRRLSSHKNLLVAIRHPQYVLIKTYNKWFCFVMLYFVMVISSAIQVKHLTILFRAVALALGLHLDSFTAPLHSPNGRHLPAVRDVQGDCHLGLKNGENSHWSREPIMQWGTRQSQSIFIATNHTSAMQVTWRPCLIPHWQSYSGSLAWNECHICRRALWRL